HQRFEPMGMTTNSNIPFAKSLVDYIFRWLGMEFVAGYKEANAPKRSTDESPADRSKASTPKGGPRIGSGSSESATGSRIPNNGAREPDCEPAPAAARDPSTATVVAEAKRLLTQTDRGGSPLGAIEPAKTATAITALDRSHAALMGDAPACDTCGAITVRNGTCYKCLNCGNSMGCS
ncbi:MAG: vitamin B12-dependent ribonucleotide reductase, partial [Planctomycetota bacterium]